MIEDSSVHCNVAYSERERCKSDIIYWIENYVYINSPYGKVSFKLFPIQKQILKEYETCWTNLYKIPRQMGVSWMYASIAVHRALSNKDSEIYCRNVRKEIEIRKKIDYIISYLPHWQKVDKSNIEYFHYSEELQRKKRSCILIEDFYKTHESTEKILNVVSVCSRMIWIEKPGFSDPKFDKLFLRYGKTIRWNEHPDRDLSWALSKVKHLGEKQFIHEYGPPVPNIDEIEKASALRTDEDYVIPPTKVSNALTSKEIMILMMIKGNQGALVSASSNKGITYGWHFTPEFAQDVQVFFNFDWNTFLTKMSNDGGIVEGITCLEDLPMNIENMAYILPLAIQGPRYN